MPVDSIARGAAVVTEAAIDTATWVTDVIGDERNQQVMRNSVKEATQMVGKRADVANEAILNVVSSVTDALTDKQTHEAVRTAVGDTAKSLAKGSEVVLVTAAAVDIEVGSAAVHGAGRLLTAGAEWFASAVSETKSEL